MPYLFGVQGQIDDYTPLGFGGQHGYYQDYTGLYLLTHRYYDSNAGRFVSRDPIGYKGGLNLYGFAGNNPVNDSDPDGTQSTNYSNPTPLLPNANSDLSPYQQYTTGHVSEYGDNYHGMARVGDGGPSLIDAIGNWFARTFRFGSRRSPKMQPALAAGGGQGSLPFNDLPPSTGRLHGNNAAGQRPTHVYEILDQSGDVYRYGESADGVRRDGKSIRAEKQARILMRQTGNDHSTRIIKWFANKADALQYQGDLIRSYERRFGKRPDGNANYR